jgi:50S ribosomal subunit-associated GTPase HflX
VFKLVTRDGDIDWVIPNGDGNRQVAEDSRDVHWQVEAIHRRLKQLTAVRSVNVGRRELSRRIVRVVIMRGDP